MGVSTSPVPVSGLTGKHLQGGIDGSAKQLLPPTLVAWSPWTRTDPSATTGVTPGAWPVGIATGDVVLAFVVYGGVSTTTPTAPSGWTRLDARAVTSGTAGSGGTGLVVAVFRHNYTAGDALPTFTYATGNRGASVVLVASRPRTAAANVSVFTQSNSSTASGTTSSGASNVIGMANLQAYHQYSVVGWMGVPSTIAPTPSASTNDPNFPSTDVLRDDNTTLPAENGSATVGAVATRAFQGGAALANITGQGIQGGTVNFGGVTNEYVAMSVALTETGTEIATTYTDLLTLVTPGTLLDGAWYELITSAPFNAKAIQLWLALQTVPQNNQALMEFIDIGLGAVGSEVVAIKDIPLQGQQFYNGASYDAPPPQQMILPLPVAAGKRVAIRAWSKDFVSGTRFSFSASALLLD